MKKKAKSTSSGWIGTLRNDFKRSNQLLSERLIHHDLNKQLYNILELFEQNLFEETEKFWLVYSENLQLDQAHRFPLYREIYSEGVTCLEKLFFDTMNSYNECKDRKRRHSLKRKIANKNHSAAVIKLHIFLLFDKWYRIVSLQNQITRKLARKFNTTEYKNPKLWNKLVFAHSLIMYIEKYQPELFKKYHNQGLQSWACKISDVPKSSYSKKKNDPKRLKELSKASTKYVKYNWIELRTEWEKYFRDESVSLKIGPIFLK